MENLTRRAFVVSTAGITTVLAGCVAAPGSDGTPSTASDTATVTQTPAEYDIPTPRRDDCRAVSLPRPTPTDEGLEPKAYPPYPDSLTKESAAGFTSQFERAYQYNDFLIRFGDKGYDDVFVTGGVPDWTMRERGEGYIVGVNVQVKTHVDDTPTGTKTPAPSGTFPTSAWYYLTDRFALRNEVGVADLVEGRDQPTFDEPTTIVCTD